MTSKKLENYSDFHISLKITVDTLTNLPCLQDACPDHVQVDGSKCCFPRELVSFVRPRELCSFEARHVICSRLIVI